MKRDFLHITDFTTEEIWETLELARWINETNYLNFPAINERNSP